MKMRKIAATLLDERIADLAGMTDHRTLAIWAADCAERVLQLFEAEYEGDDRPRQAIAGCRGWARTGVFKMTDVRRKALAAHAAAREVKDNAAARSAARAAGQAMATAHVAAHSIAAALYSATAVRDATNSTDADPPILKEREWQYQHLLQLKNKI